MLTHSLEVAGSRVAQRHIDTTSEADEDDRVLKYCAAVEMGGGYQLTSFFGQTRSAAVINCKESGERAVSDLSTPCESMTRSRTQVMENAR